MLKSAQITTRESAQSAIISIVPNCSNPMSIGSLLNAYTDALIGKVAGSSLTNDYQKISILNALLQSCSVLNKFYLQDDGDIHSLTHIVDQSILSLFNCTEKEPDDSIRLLL